MRGTTGTCGTSGTFISVLQEHQVQVVQGIPNVSWHVIQMLPTKFGVADLQEFCGK